jgi:aryl-alcohol dehydrogenase-like predicted oxidoreductase
MSIEQRNRARHMQYRQLGPTTHKVSQLALGTMVFGWRTTPDVASRMIDHAVAAGVNLIDTSNSYGRGLSELIIGDALTRSGRRNDVILSTKFHLTPRPDEERPAGDLSHYIRHQCEHSLRRLRTDRIDLYHIHGPCTDIPNLQIIEALDDLVKAGKVIRVGTSNFSVSQLAEISKAARHPGSIQFVAEQAPYNLLDRSIEDDLLPFAAAQGLKIIAWSPLAEGILSGQYKRGKNLPTESRYAKIDRAGTYAQRLSDRVFDRVEALERFAQRKGISLPCLSLAWAMMRPEIASVVVGPRTLEQLDKSLTSIQVQLSDADQREIDLIALPSSAVSRYVLAPSIPSTNPNL